MDAVLLTVKSLLDVEEAFHFPPIMESKSVSIDTKWLPVGAGKMMEGKDVAIGS